ncbi:hypothetical protein ACWF9X_04110 [Streptomyces globisporus]
MAPASVIFAFNERISRIELETFSTSSCISELARTGVSTPSSSVPEQPERIEQRRIAQTAALHALLFMLDPLTLSRNHGGSISETN